MSEPASLSDLTQSGTDRSHFGCSATARLGLALRPHRSTTTKDHLAACFLAFMVWLEACDSWNLEYTSAHLRQIARAAKPIASSFVQMSWKCMQTANLKMLRHPWHAFRLAVAISNAIAPKHCQAHEQVMLEIVSGWDWTRKIETECTRRTRAMQLENVASSLQ